MGWGRTERGGEVQKWTRRKKKRIGVWTLYD